MNNSSFTFDPSHQKTLLKISCTLNSSLDLEEVLNTALVQVLDLLKAERGLIMLSENGQLHLKAMKSFLENDILEGREISHGVIDQVYQTGTPVVTLNAMDDQRFAQNQSVIFYQLRSVLCVPLKIKDQTTGIIYLDNQTKTGIFSNRDIETLTMFANHAAIAIENARLFQNLKLSIDEKLKLQEEIFRERTRTEIERETNKLREDLVHYLVHDLRNPLTIVYSTFGVLREMVERVMVQPDEKELLKRCEYALKSISKMLNDILDVFLLENNELLLDKTRFDMKSTIQKVLEEFRIVKESSVRLESEFEVDPFEAFGDKDLLIRVLSNLVQNAFKLTKEGYIKITGGYSGTSIWVEVCDTGPGIPEEYRERIFSKFSRVERQGQPGVSRGLGLAFCRLAIMAHGGTIQAMENPSGGTCMRFEIPNIPSSNDVSGESIQHPMPGQLEK